MISNQILQSTIDGLRSIARVELCVVDVDGKRVIVSLGGRCAQCRASAVTLHDLVQRLLREHVEPDLIVEEA